MLTSLATLLTLTVQLTTLPAEVVAEPEPGYDDTPQYYTCEFLGYCPDEPVDQLPEMWRVVECFEAVGKVCPPTDEEER